MTKKEFENLVAEEYKEIPDEWKKLVKNCALLIEDEPDDQTRKEQELEASDTLLGLYRGVPQSVRGDAYGMGLTLPDSITIYRLPILEMAGARPEKIRRTVRETLWHEIAHHFGFSEQAVSQKEREAKNYFKGVKSGKLKP